MHKCLLKAVLLNIFDVINVRHKIIWPPYLHLSARRNTFATRATQPEEKATMILSVST